MIKFGIMKWCGHHQLKFLCGQIFLLSLRTLGLISPEWIGSKNTIGNSFTDNSLKFVVNCLMVPNAKWHSVRK